MSDRPYIETHKIRAQDIEPRDILLHEGEWCFVHASTPDGIEHWFEQKEEEVLKAHGIDCSLLDERDTVVLISRDQSRELGADASVMAFVLYPNPYQLVEIQVEVEA